MVKHGCSPGREDYDICFDFCPIRELEAFLGETLDGAAALDLDVTIDDVLARTGVY